MEINTDNLTWGYDPYSHSWVIGPKEENGCIASENYLGFYSTAEEARQAIDELKRSQKGEA